MRTLASTLLIAILYYVFFIFLNNYSLVYSTVVAQFPMHTKLNIIVSLLTGIGTSLSGLNIIILGIVAVLTGLNSTLLFQNLKVMKSYGSMKVVVGGSSLLGLVSTGCASCGLPLLAFLGLGSSVSFLPLKGLELSLLTIILLLTSTFFLIKKLKTKSSCEVDYEK